MALQFKHLHMNGIVKQFPGVLACDHVDFDVQAGEIHALLGENGAGKSTLMKILYGLYRHDEGDILVNDEPLIASSPTDTIARGIGMIHQHFMLVPSLTVVENIALGLREEPADASFMSRLRSRSVLNLGRVRKRLVELSETYNLRVNPDSPIWQLSVGEQQRVEILRALYKGSELLILDEPTAVLTPQEVDDLFLILRQMADDGRGLIFISHKLHEVLNLTHRITVLRDGRRVGSIATPEATKEILAEMMVGRPVVFQYDQQVAKRGPVRLAMSNVESISDRGTPGLSGVSMDLHAGEIVGIAGVSGNGQKELAEVIAGLRTVTAGTVTALDTDITNAEPAKIKALGISYIPEERMVDGIIKDFSVAENYILRDCTTEHYAANGLFMRFSKIKQACEEAIQAYAIKTPHTSTKAKSLSGGNIQKLVLARELSSDPEIIIASQPTRGVDIGAIEYIHHRLLEERDSGKAILLISEDLDEVLLLADRILVIYEGQFVGEVDRDDVVIEEIGKMMAGSAQHEMA